MAKDLDCCAFHYEVCPQCNGRGVSSAHLGAYTADEWDQMDQEWQDDYRAGNFAETCRRCDGRNVVPVHAAGCEIAQLERDEASERRYFAAIEGW